MIVNGSLRRYFKGKNVMTPDIHAYGRQGSFVWELSSGTDFQDQPLYGVTVVQALYGKPTDYRHDLSHAFDTEADARDYIKRGFQEATS